MTDPLDMTQYNQIQLDRAKESDDYTERAAAYHEQLRRWQIEKERMSLLGVPYPEERK